MVSKALRQALFVSFRHVKANKKENTYISKVSDGDAMTIEKYTRDELEKLKDRSDIECLKNTLDEEIEKSDADSPPLTDEHLKSF